MNDYSRPASQHPDAADQETALATWSWRYDSINDLYVLQTGRPATRAAFVPSTSDPDLYVMVEQVNGEAEALLMQTGETIHQYV